MQKFKKILVLLLTNPILLIIYWFCFYELEAICRYGRGNNKLYKLLALGVVFVAISVFIIVRVIKDKKNKSLKILDSQPWKLVSLIIILLITVFYGEKIYESATSPSYKLYWFADKLKNEKNIKFENNNIYKDGVRGIFIDIDKKCDLPEELYLANVFECSFESDGTITNIYTFVYGKDKEGNEQTYLVDYDKRKSEDLRVWINGYADTDYNKDELIEPLIKTVDSIDVKRRVSSWNQKKYSLRYYGKRTWNLDTKGLIEIDEKGNEIYSETAAYYDNAEEQYKFGYLEPSQRDITGYTVSIFVDGKEDEIIPARYNLSTFNYLCTPSYDKDVEIAEEEPNEQFFVTKDKGYKLQFVEKALGSSLYSFAKTEDKGITWETVNENPFNRVIGSVTGIYFLDEKIGFVAVASVSDDYGELYRTDDGGRTFIKIEFEPQKVKLEGGASIEPFDFPNVPYEEDGELYIKLGQGSDGDYNGGTCKALYKSKDKGVTWMYEKEIEDE